MSIIASRITATLTALIAICGAVVYLLSPARDGVITSFPVILAVLGLLGPCAIIAAHRDSDTMALHIVAVICGVLVALAFNTVMSIGPLAGLSAFTLALSLVIICRSKRERLRPMILTLGISTILSFGILYSIVMRAKIETVTPPPSSVILHSLPGHHFTDAFQVRISTDEEPGIRSIVDAFSVSLRPWWFEIPEHGGIADAEIRPGSDLGGWKVHEMSRTEIIIGLDRSYIDLRISLYAEQADGQCTITATTVARYNNWLGRLYFVPVRYGHKIVLADTMRRISFLLQELPALFPGGDDGGLPGHE